MQNVRVESVVIADGSAAGVLEGRSCNRVMIIGFHKLMFEALNRLAWNEFQRWIEEHHEDQKPCVDDLMNGLKQLIEPEFKDVMRSPLFEEISQLFLSYSNHLHHGNGKLSKFWMSYVDMVEVLLGLITVIRATREGNWSMHLSSLRGIVPWCFAYDNVSYAGYLSAYLLDMSHLPEEHPDAFKYVSSGGLSVELGNSNPFGRVPVDQTCEETVNKDTQTSRGRKGFNLKPNAVCKYYLVAKYRSTFLRQLRDMLHINSFSPKHNDLHRSRITREATDVKNIISLLQDTWLNPLNPELQDLVWLTTGKVAPSEVQDDLLRAKDLCW